MVRSLFDRETLAVESRDECGDAQIDADRDVARCHESQ
jgi:hypothetical protein